MDTVRSWFCQAQDTYQLLAGSPYLPTSRRLQLRSKRFASRSSSTGGGFSANGGSGWRWRGGGSPPSSTLCGVLVLVPWFTLVLLTVLLWRSKLHSNLPMLVNDIPGGRQCTGWKQTFFCHPFA